MFFRNAVKILRHISYCFSTQFHFFCNDSWCHLIVSNQDSTIAFCFAENEHRICGNRTMMMMMSDVVLVNTLVLIIYFEHASAACTDLSTFPATRHDRHFDRLFLTKMFCSFFLLLSSAESPSLKNKLRGRRGILSGGKVHSIAGHSGQFDFTIWLTRKLVFGQQIDF